jgi:DNA gyrase subunit A
LATQPPIDDNSTPPTGDSDIVPISIVEEMKASYLDYAMSVIVSRALPDVRDGLKPVHRRILYAAQEGGFVAASVQEIGEDRRRRDGNYHPHGDAAIYDALARMTADWSTRGPAIDGQGTSVDGPDPPASMRYTEAARQGRKFPARRLRQGHRRFQPNYDGSRQELQCSCTLSKPVGQRRRGHRRRNGDEHTALATWARGAAL